MSLGDRIRAFFSKRRNPELPALAEFAQTRKGVEGFIEPQTSTNPTTLLLVDRDGDSRRAPVRDPEDAVAFCDQHGLPVYDAQVVGYPKRMKEFERGGRRQREQLDEQFAEIEKRLRETPSE